MWEEHSTGHRAQKDLKHYNRENQSSGDIPRSLMDQAEIPTYNWFKYPEEADESK